MEIWKKMWVGVFFLNTVYKSHDKTQANEQKIYNTQKYAKTNNCFYITFGEGSYSQKDGWSVQGAKKSVNAVWGCIIVMRCIVVGEKHVLRGPRM